VKQPIILLLLSSFTFKQTFAQKPNEPGIGQYPPFTEWYQNPLGISPISLHTANGIIIPVLAATTILLFTKKDTTLTNRLSWYDDIGVSFGYYASKTTVYQNNFGMLYQVRKYMSLGAEFSTVYVYDDVNSTWGLGVRPFVRFYPVNKNDFKLFFQSGAGLIYFAENYPKPSGFFGDNREGTKLNGSPKYGIGTEFRLNKNLFAQVALWHIHFSNGDHPSYDRNPGHDSNGFSFGLMYTPDKGNK